MNVEKRIALITATPARSQIDAILLSGCAQNPGRPKLYNDKQLRLGVTQTIWRMVKDDRLQVIEIRRGPLSGIPSAALTSMFQVGNI